MSLLNFITTVAALIQKAAPKAERLNDADARLVADYLRRFGHLDIAEPSKADDVAKAVVEVQELLGTEKDGWVGHETFAAMDTPRCGVISAARVADQINRWNVRRAKTGITWRIERYLRHFSIEKQNELMAKAFAMWTAISGIVFVPAQPGQTADIVITTSSNRRDGLGTKGATLAYAYLPQGENFIGQLQMVIDEAEDWSELMLLLTLAHEIGHLAGIDHTQVQRNALMYPTLNMNIDGPQPGFDTDEAVKRYGGPLAAPPPPVPPPTPVPPVPPVDPDGLDITGFISIEGLPYKLVRA